MSTTPIIQPISVPDEITETPTIGEASPARGEPPPPSAKSQVTTAVTVPNVLEQMDPEVRQWAQAVPTGIVTV